MTTSKFDRRNFLKAVAGASLLSMPTWMNAVRAQVAAQDKILVVFELSGGNDGLNSIVPFADDAYYRHRPKIGIKQDALLPLDDHFGFNRGMLGFKRLWDKGQLAIVHGCGYENPSYSHFTSMAYYHTAAPNSGAEFGWYGRLADQMAPDGRPNFLVNIDASQSLAVASRLHTPVVFDDPDEFQSRAFGPLPQVEMSADGPEATGNKSLDFLKRAARSGQQAAGLIRTAWSNYKTPIDYGIIPLDLDKIAASIAADFPARLYYTSFRNNAFDTHVQQGPLHSRLLSYACDAIHGFIADLERLGLADRVVVMAFSEFGRRVTENTNLGTDHGTANVMFLAGAPVKGGHYGTPPSLTVLRDDDNIAPTADFRQVYATAIDWVAPGLSAPTLGGDFSGFDALG